jgi:hypothetical protein
MGKPEVKSDSKPLGTAFEMYRNAVLEPSGANEIEHCVSFFSGAAAAFMFLMEAVSGNEDQETIEAENIDMGDRITTLGDELEAFRTEINQTVDKFTKQTPLRES